MSSLPPYTTELPDRTITKSASVKGVSKRVKHSYIGFNWGNMLVLAGSRRFSLSVVGPAVLMWHAHGAAALWEHISLRVIATPLVRTKKLVSAEDAPPLLFVLLQGKNKYPRMRTALSSKGNSFDGA